MKVIVGCVVKKDDKILMVKEAKKFIYGKWSYPAGKLEEHEKIMDGALRETFEETGCKVKLTGVFPITNGEVQGENKVLIRFLAEIVEENIAFNKDEILDVKWISMEDIKKMKQEELRGEKLDKKLIEDIENNNIYPLEIIDNNEYNL